MSRTGHYHSKIIFIAIIYTQLVLNGSTRLNYSSNPCFVRNFHTIRKWEKSITGHYSSLKIKFKGICFINTLSQGINPGCLACSACQ